MPSGARGSSQQIYSFLEFPKWKYHKDFRLAEATGEEMPGKAEVVQNHDAELALGSNWYDSPQEAAKAREPKAAAPPPEPEPDYRQPGFKRSNPIHMTTEPTRY